MPKERDGQKHFCELCQDTFQSTKPNTSTILAFRSHWNTNKRHKLLLAEKNVEENDDEMGEDGNEGGTIDFYDRIEEDFFKRVDDNEMDRDDVGKEDENQKADHSDGASDVGIKNRNEEQMEEDENLEDELDRVDVIFPARVQFDFDKLYNWSPLEKRGDDNDFDQFEGGLDMNDILGNGVEPDKADGDGDGDGNGDVDGEGDDSDGDEEDADIIRGFLMERNECRGNDMIIVQEILLDFLYDQEKSLVKFNKVNEGNPVNKKAALLLLEQMVTEHMSREKADEFLKFQHELHESLNDGRPMNMVKSSKSLFRAFLWKLDEYLPVSTCDVSLPEEYFGTLRTSQFQ